MHDPMVVAFEIRRPWPSRHSHPIGKARWRFKGSFWTLAGHAFYWPSVITVWHVEPLGRDSGTVCKHYRREQLPDGTWKATILRGWRWHIHHWHIQVSPYQAARRWLLTRCEWCGGKSRKRDRANVSHSWHHEKTRWWRGEAGLFHHDCSSVATAHRTCVCLEPIFEHDLGGVAYGTCARCLKFRAWHKSGQDDGLRATRILAAIPSGRRDKEAIEQAAHIWSQIRRERERA
jgi:hypothetical protein